MTGHTTVPTENMIQNKEFDSKLKIVPTENKSKTPYINERVKMISGKSIKSAIGMPYIDADKNDRTYNRTDLKYDLKQKLITLKPIKTPKRVTISVPIKNQK